MMPSIVVLASLLSSLFPQAQEEKQAPLPSFDYHVARAHEIKPHRRTIPLRGVRPGFNQLHLTLVVSPSGDVLEADPGTNDDLLKFWPKLQHEVKQWKFIPFEKNGRPVTSEIEEYIDLVPPERLPKKHLAAPILRPNSEIKITLRRTGCFGSCPSYEVTTTIDGVLFNGHGYVVASGEHIDGVSAHEVRKLAADFIAADFYSMDSSYRASVTDNPTYVLSISIDGRVKTVEDYVGEWEGMPAVITELENKVDSLARTERWIEGGDGLVDALQLEHFNFRTFDAQLMLKESATRGLTETVQQLLEAGVPLQPFPAPKPEEPYMTVPFEHVGWLTAASANPETLRVLIGAAASKHDQNDKDLALVGAARSGKLEAVRALIAYGADPNTDLSKLRVTETIAGGSLEGPGAGSMLIYAAESGNPEVVREMLAYHPKLEARDDQGRTAVFAASEYRYKVEDDARVECLRLLAKAGANVNARDNAGRTALHVTFLTPVEEELLQLGADVNARDNDGETPIFTTYDDDAIALFIKHGADLSIRNNKGETVMEAAKGKGPSWQEALRKALQSDEPK
jgi:ankyrin repeat protein